MSVSVQNVRAVLFLQKAEVLAAQRQSIVERLREGAPGLVVHCYGAAAEVPLGLAVDAVIAPTLPWLQEALDRVSGYRWIHFLSAGVEAIWSKEYSKRDTLLTKSSGVHGAPMSEYAIGAMLHFAKSFDVFVEQARQSDWRRSWLDELTGRTLMVLGKGHIGNLLAERARIFGMNVLGVQRRPKREGGDAASIAIDEVGAYLKQVDYLAICLPLTDETKGLVDGAFLCALKRGAVVIDISRGGIVVEKALVEALERGHLRGAAVDVFECEPLPKESRLWNNPRVLLTPHVSGTSPHYMDRAIDIFLANLNAMATGEPALTRVDPLLRY